RQPGQIYRIACCLVASVMVVWLSGISCLACCIIRCEISCKPEAGELAREKTINRSVDRTISSSSLQLKHSCCMAQPTKQRAGNRVIGNRKIGNSEINNILNSISHSEPASLTAAINPCCFLMMMSCFDLIQSSQINNRHAPVAPASVEVPIEVV